MTVIPFPHRDDRRVHVEDPASEARGLVIALAIMAVFYVALAVALVAVLIT